MKIWPLFVLFAVIALSNAECSIYKMDSLHPVPEADRVRVQKAAESLATSGSNLAALETLIATFPPEMLSEVGTSVSEGFIDPVREAAWRKLTTFYSTAFLEDVLRHGSDDAVYWAIRVVRWQEMNGPTLRGHDASADLVKKDGIVTEAFLRRLIPVLEELRDSKLKRASKAAREFIDERGLPVDRSALLESLEETNEVILNESLMRLIDKMRLDPQVTVEIWNILANAKSENLKLTCLRYPWLFALPEWDARKARTLARCFDGQAGMLTNLNLAMRQLALSSNPLAGKILAGLPTDRPQFAKRTAKYRELYTEKHPHAK